MSTTTPDHLRPLAPYEARYANEPRQFAMPDTTDPAVWATWRTAFRKRLRALLGGLPAETEGTPPPFTAAAPTAHAGYLRTYIEFESEPGVTVPAWLLVPDNLSAPAPAVVAVHGHGYGVDDTVGINSDGTDRDEPQGYHQDFAVALARRGMVVIAPELSGFGRRREDEAKAKGPTNNSCHAAAWWGIMLGKPLLGSRVRDVRRTFDLLQSLPEVDPQRIGIMGSSGGGMAALFSAALDERFRAVVISNYFCTFRDSILAMEHCHCNYLPGLLQDAEMYDVAALVAPRPLLVVTGDADPIFPLHGAQEAYERLHGGYEALGVADRLQKHVFAGGHQINGEQAYPFLQQWLGSEELS